ncbi:MAG: type II toxin-antitoxin system RelE/ParE family toxin [Myxococcota bacterium]|nr:type II toxin-antitoxin system RelE/ParE family toxin [Myxococcota bacterium]
MDLIEIGDFIAADSPAAAERWIEKLLIAGERIGVAPLAGRRVPELSRDDVREVLVRNYRIVYRVHARRVEVLTVFEGHRRLRLDPLGEDD